MELKEQEQLIRIVSRVGNGAHVFAPKEWVNEKVLIIRLEKKSIKEQILERIYPHLDKIIAVFLYGSYARKEANELSDIDVLVITKEKFSLEKKEGWDITIIAQEKFQKAIEINPILIYSLLKEAVPIINEDYLENFKKSKINYKYFKPFLEETLASLKSDKEILELDKKTGNFASSSLIYSMFLRLRGIFIINSLLKRKDYSNLLFKRWVLNNCKVKYEKIYNSYIAIRDNKKGKEEVSLIEAESLLILLEKELAKATEKIGQNAKA